MHFMDPLSSEQNSDEDRINSIDIVEHKIELEWIYDIKYLLYRNSFMIYI